MENKHGAIIGCNGPVRDAPGMEGVILEGGIHVLLVQGPRETQPGMSFLAGYLSSQGYPVTCPPPADPGSSGSLFRRAGWEKCYCPVKDALAGIPPGEDVFACGLASGALLSLLLAMEFPSRVRGVSAISPIVFCEGRNTPWYRKLLPLSPQELLARQITPRLPQVRVPVQIVQARDDGRADARDPRFIYDRVASGVKELVMFNHPFQAMGTDTERGDVARRIGGFIARCGKGRGPARKAVRHG